MKEKFYNKTWFLWVMLIFVAPIGIFMLWRNKKYTRNATIGLSVVFAAWFIFVLVGPKPNVDTNTNQQSNTIQTERPKEEPKEQSKEEPKTPEEQIKTVLENKNYKGINIEPKGDKITIKYEGADGYSNSSNIDNLISQARQTLGYLKDNEAFKEYKIVTLLPTMRVVDKYNKEYTQKAMELTFKQSEIQKVSDYVNYSNEQFMQLAEKNTLSFNKILTKDLKPETLELIAKNQN